MERRGLAAFPSFSNEAQLMRALRDQGFSVERRGAGWVIRNESGDQRSFHSDSIVNRYGSRRLNALRLLVDIGFIPPAEFEQRRRDQRAVERREMAAMDSEVVTIPESQLASLGTPESQPVPDLRAFECEFCRTERCKICAERDEPCAFPKAMNLGRHLTAIHGQASHTRREAPAAPPTEQATTRPPRKTRARRQAAPVRTRREPDAVGDPVRRALIALQDALEVRDRELRELRAYKARVEKLVGNLYDEATKPPK